ncbi:MaoC family dehydratase [Paeniglutamicibacter sp. ABSL32-1]|uniref:MaoC family dehydratase n=1 Tax=Paeniglutamicibacter quisquiliarum TaxID=2849498 RepID=UPI001C2D1485|nr:MaoC family dehydratase [Paeniglutamicibacter quisquiliarum]MBV1778928.1 MaoC family dehydratase [Paeniglutamicibacter quisquiliarum]
MNPINTQQQASVAIPELRNLVGVELGPSSDEVITQDRINRFAEATGDWQWIHTDPEKAAATPAGSTIAHGFLVLSLIAGVNQQLLSIPDAKSRLNYGLDRVRFPASVPVDSVLRGFTTLKSVESVRAGIQLKFEVRLEADGIAKPVCIAEFISLIPGVQLETTEQPA